MRTREEQIAALASEFVTETGMGDGFSLMNARAHILEAERRAEQRVRAEIARDSERLDWLESGCCDVRFRPEPIADTGDADVYCDIVQHHMSNPKERVIGSAYTIRSAIDAAREVAKFDTNYTDNIICPHCGYEDYDSWECGDGEDAFETTCDRCGEEIGVVRHVSVSYSSKKLEADND
ncbi:hypothetical protein K6W37_10015 [Acetobacter senegalensis]|uniref:hypothetical protein n=1 Tax=Acetobacter senegalensis TaxID=446692 RepID=UPI001EDC8536|nr:hypothetical protein [Acetobacter senegalensis]MCG4254220.1 hypothetical protein [Acetobacter senegalensis]